MPTLPSGTVTFLFTDIEGSTALWERDRTAMAAAVARHLALLTDAIAANGGIHFKTVGDAVQAAFTSATAAIAAALEGQQALQVEEWGAAGPLRVRMALHTGDAQPDDQGDYLAAPLNRLARLLESGAGGQVLLTQAVQQLSRGALPPGAQLRDLGEHRLRDLLEPERIYQLVHPALPADFPPLRTLASRPNNLPLQPTPFLGRELEVPQVVALMRRPDVRFLTLTGPGGTGKSRLALQAAVDLLDDFRDGVFYVPLASLTDPDLVPAAVAGALGMREEGGHSPRERLRDVLASKQLLLVLDNLEHLVAAAPAIGELLGGAPALNVLATSRSPLRLRAEHEYAVPPLGLPRRKPPPPPEQLSQFEAVRLFIDRAQAVKADFAVDNETAPAIAEICWRLDGLPLAIELAAARVRMVSPQAMLSRLEQRLPMLTGGARDAPERQRTLRNTVAWSYNLLAPAEQQVFRQLAVFAGGLTLEAADAVTNPTGELDSFGVLERLVEHSLLRQEAGQESEPRFGLLETIREFGLEHLTSAGEENDVRSRHAAFFLAMVEEAAPGLHGPHQGAWMERLETEHDNVRSALGWALGQEPATALRFVAALHWFWTYRGHLSEGRDWTERALAAGVSPAPDVMTRALNWSGAFAWGQADRATTAARSEQALALARQSGDQSGEGWALINLAIVAAEQGALKQSVALSAEAETLLARAGDRHGVAASLFNQGIVAGMTGDVAAKRALLERSIAESRAIGDRIQAAWTISSMVGLERERGNREQARLLLEEALATAREFRFGRIESSALLGLAELAGERGDVGQVESYLQEARGTHRDLGRGLHGLSLAYGLNDFGYLVLERGDVARARGLFEEAIAVAREAAGPAASAGFLHSLGEALQAAGDYPGAAQRYRDALLLAREADQVSVVSSSLSGLASLAAATGQNDRATRLMRAVATLADTAAVPSAQPKPARQTRETMAALLDGEDTTDAETGDMAFETAVQDALALAEELAAGRVLVDPHDPATQSTV